MSTFFTNPVSKNKRNASRPIDRVASKRRSFNSRSSQPSITKKSKADTDDSVSSSDIGDESDVPLQESQSSQNGLSSESDDETAGERRLRLAEQYLKNTKEEIDEAGFDAREIDRDLIAERLREDVAESKGKLYRLIASKLALNSTSYTHCRTNQHSVTGIAACGQHVYTVSKDITLSKWNLNDSDHATANEDDVKGSSTSRRKPQRLLSVKGNRSRSSDPAFKGHVAQILCIAASSTGKFVASGGADRRLVIWDASNLSPLKVFYQHRDAVTGVAFRRNTNQLYSCSSDRTIKVWSLDELAYVETLFGHQDTVVDVATLALERCVTVGARDRTARLWKVIEESQLLFRGGGALKKEQRNGERNDAPLSKTPETIAYDFEEGSLDRVALIDEDTFVTGGDNGALSLWNIHKKKPVYVLPAAHDFDPPLHPLQVFAEELTTAKSPGPPLPRWITALCSLPFTNIVVSGSWNDNVRAWMVSEDKRKLEPLGPLPLRSWAEDCRDSDNRILSNRTSPTILKGVVNDLLICENSEKNSNALIVVAGIGNEHRLGRWLRTDGRSGLAVFRVPFGE